MANLMDPLGIRAPLNLSYEIRNANMLLGSLKPDEYAKMGHPELAAATKVLEGAIFAWGKLADQANRHD